MLAVAAKVLKAHNRGRAACDHHEHHGNRRPVDRRSAFDQSGVSKRTSENEEKPCSPFQRQEAGEPHRCARDHGEIETRHHNEMILTTYLKLAFDLRRQAILPAQHHPQHEAADIRPRCKRRFQPALYPVLDPIEAVPSGFQNRNEGGPDRACPVDSLPLQIAPIVEHARVEVHTRTM